MSIEVVIERHFDACEVDEPCNIGAKFQIEFALPSVGDPHAPKPWVPKTDPRERKTYGRQIRVHLVLELRVEGRKNIGLAANPKMAARR